MFVKATVISSFIAPLLLAGCNNLSAQTPGSSVPAIGISAAQAPLAPRAVRISRGFFFSPFSASVLVDSPSGKAVLDSPTEASRWVEYPTELPPPAPTEETGPVLADFRDFKGCAVLEGAQGLAVCFNVMPDVESVGMNAKDMSLEQVAQAVPSDCDPNEGHFAFQEATHTTDEYHAVFAWAGTGCQATITISLRKI